jgi:alpha-beta hydrolase superfamily lysophospholipase
MPPPAAPDLREGAWSIMVNGDGIRFAGLRWGPTGTGPGLGRIGVLLHGVQSAAVTTARMARAMAADGWNAVALDMPGHGDTVWLDGGRPGATPARVPAWSGRRSGAGGEAGPIGHSWGADIALAIVVSGRSLERVVLIDPPAMAAAKAAELAAEDVAELRPGDLDAARAIVAAAGAVTDPLDAEAKAQALTTISPLAIEAVYRGDEMWRPQIDARRWADLPDAPPLDLIASDPALGGLIPRPAFNELRSILGADRVHFLGWASHSPQRTEFERFWPLLRSILG